MIVKKNSQVHLEKLVQFHMKNALTVFFFLFLLFRCCRLELGVFHSEKCAKFPVLPRLQSAKLLALIIARTGKDKKCIQCTDHSGKFKYGTNLRIETFKSGTLFYIILYFYSWVSTIKYRSNKLINNQTCHYRRHAITQCTGIFVMTKFKVQSVYLNLQSAIAYTAVYKMEGGRMYCKRKTFPPPLYPN